MNDAQPNLRYKLFPWLHRREPNKSKVAYTVKYRIDSAGSMHIQIFEDGKKLREEGYLLSSNLTWARLWTPYYTRKAKRAKKRDEKVARLNKRTDVDVDSHLGNRFDPYEGSW